LKVETRGDHARIGKLAVSLDEGVVYTAPAGFVADDETTIYDHAVAPGRHILGVDADRRDDRGETFRTGQHSRVTLEVPENQRLETTIRIDDDSDMGADFPSGQKGSCIASARPNTRTCSHYSCPTRIAWSALFFCLRDQGGHSALQRAAKGPPQLFLIHNRWLTAESGADHCR
jgi:hypothetical protein